MDLLFDPAAWTAFVTLVLLEIVLGIDNIVFISVLVDRLPEKEREFARKLGIFLAMLLRILLLFLISWIIGLSSTLLTIFDKEISWRDIILICGGLFLLWKSTKEIHDMIDTPTDSAERITMSSFGSVIIQIILIDAVFSLDSIITAIGLVDQVVIMVAAVIVSVIIMVIFAGSIGRFVSNHPTFKMLALAFLFVIGVLLIADGFDHHIPKGYIYFAMAFSLAVEALNMRIRAKNAT
jgi:predicted tellurium resistance membrane protein TerC